jgi:hypothetical protein
VHVDYDGDAVTDVMFRVTGLTTATQLVAGDFQFI